MQNMKYKNAIVCTNGKKLTEQDKKALDEFIEYRKKKAKKLADQKV